MKTNSLFSALLISSLLISTAACTPRDVKVSGDNGANSFGNGGGNKAQKNATVFSMGNFAIAAYIGERHIEVIELVKLATGSLAPVDSTYAVEDGQEKEAGVLTKKLTSSKDTLTYIRDEEEWDYTSTKNFTATYTKDTVVTSAKIEGSDIASKSRASRKFFVNSLDKTYSINVTPDAAGLLKIDMQSAGILSGAKGQEELVKDISVKIVMVVDAASLETNEVLVKSVDSIMFYPNPNFKGKGTAVFSMPFKGQNLTVKLKSQCNSMLGQANAEAGKAKFTASFDDNAVSIIDRDWKQDLAACGERPTMELSRLHIY